MTDCGCDKAKQELEEYLHNELKGADAADIRDHMEHCASCSGEHQVGVMLTEAVKRACKDQAPSELRDQVLLKLRTLQSH